MTEIERGSTRRDENDDDRRGEYRRLAHRRKASKNVENDRRIVLDQRQGYQRKSNRRESSDRRD
ncbi:MAG: hypothetical protein HOI03_05535 [Candidatus Marinimicrobia bacterium]|nr:hypothetical protein [Candidatus Neomarinimicrobiota bacterium]